MVFSIIELQEPLGAYFRAPGASRSLFSSSRSFQELIFELWELPGAYFRASGSLFSASKSFRELIFNLQELLGARFQPPGAYFQLPVVPGASKIPSNEASKTQIGSAGVAKRKQSAAPFGRYGVFDHLVPTRSEASYLAPSRSIFEKLLTSRL